MKFLYYEVLFLMLIPTIFLMYLIVTKKSGVNRYFSAKALNKLIINNGYFSLKARNSILFLSLTCMILALARPVSDEKIENIQAQITPIVIALDVSKSMKAVDVYPTRLELAKNKISDLLSLVKNEALGVILFAKSSYILSPLTQDFTSLNSILNNLDTGLNFDSGTNILSTLQTANRLLKNNSKKIVLLFSDGGDEEDFSKEIEFAKANKIEIYVVCIGTKNGGAIKLEDGNFFTDKTNKIVNVSINEKIKELALQTNGGYINFSFDNSDVRQILDDIRNKNLQREKVEKKIKTYTELFYYPLLLGIFLLLIANSSLPTLRKKVNLFILSFCLFYFTPSKAGILDFYTIKEATKSYERKDYKTAQNQYEKLESTPQRDYDLANSLYKNGDYKKAMEYYKNIKTENRDLNFQRLHNLGNSYVKTNDLQNAKKSYEDALKLKADEETRKNLDLVNEVLKNNEQQNQQNQDNNKNQKDINNKEENKKQNNQNKEEKQEKQDNSQKSQQNLSENEKNSERNSKQKEQKEENKIEDKQKEKDKQNLKSDRFISDFEEQKWLKDIEKQKIKPLLKQENSNEDETPKPW